MVVDRPGTPVELPDVVDWIRVEVPRLEVSSTDLRARFTDGRPLDYLVTEPVLEVIAAARSRTGGTSDGIGVAASPRHHHRPRRHDRGDRVRAAS